MSAGAHSDDAGDIQALLDQLRAKGAASLTQSELLGLLDADDTCECLTASDLAAISGALPLSAEDKAAIERIDEHLEVFLIRQMVVELVRRRR